MGRRRKKRIKRSHPPGTLPGTLVAHEEADAAPVQIFLFSYDPDHCEERSLRPDEIASLTVPDNGVLWIDIWGLADPGVVKAVGDRFGFHPLALEDVLNVGQRPKVDRYESHLLIVLREVRYPEETEQVSLFLSERIVVTFQERAGDPFVGFGEGWASSGRRGRTTWPMRSAMPLWTPTSRSWRSWAMRWRPWRRRRSAVRRPRYCGRSAG
jgi:magnesium transporter